jgi:putative ABC transport system substrate-binding protein
MRLDFSLGTATMPDREESGQGGDLHDSHCGGTKPSDIPIEQPSRFLLTINLQVAQQMGLLIPPSAIAMADKVIQ